MTVAETARKQGKAALRFIVDCVTAYVDGQTQPKLLSASYAA